MNEKLSKRFKDAKPFEHICIEKFISPSEARKVRLALLKEEFVRRETDLYSFSQAANLERTRNPVLKRFFKKITSREMVDFVSDVAGIKVGKADFFGAIYRPTDYLLPHDDLLRGRKIAYLIYLNESFTKRDGGALSLFSHKNGRPVKIAASIMPKLGSLAMFKVSKVSFHQVDEVLRNHRVSIGGWFYAR